MKTLLLLAFVFCLTKAKAQEDGHVLLHLGLDSVFSKIKENQAGGSVFIQRGNELLYSKSFGLANVKTKEEFSETTSANISSITETFIAYAILVLQKQGTLNIDDSLVKFFPDYKNKAEVKNIRIMHLLSHTSGFPNVATIEKNMFYKPDFEAGSNYKYSKMDYLFLKEIIEKVSDVKWQTFIRDNVFGPAGMLNTIISEDKIVSKVNALATISARSSINELRKYINAIRECVFLPCEITMLPMQSFKSDNWRSLKSPVHGFSWIVHEEKNRDKIVENDCGAVSKEAHIILYPERGITVIWLSASNTSFSEFIKKQLLQWRYIK